MRHDNFAADFGPYCGPVYGTELLLFLLFARALVAVVVCVCVGELLPGHKSPWAQIILLLFQWLA